MSNIIKDIIVNKSIFYQLWLRRRPLSMQQILPVGDSDADVDNITKLTDKIYERRRHTSPQMHNSTIDERIDTLRKAKIILCHKLTSLYQDDRKRSWLRSRSRDRGRSFSMRLSAPTICWYNQTFGYRARKHISPCKSK